MHCAADRKLEECAKQRQKPQVPGKPLQLEKTKQQSTCVSKLMLTGAEWKRKELSLVTTEDIIQTSVSYAEWIFRLFTFLRILPSL